jgi:transposase
MGERLAAVRAKGMDKQDWQRYYNQHQQTYKRSKLKAVELAVGHTGSFRSLARELGCSKTSLANWLDCYLSKGLKGLVEGIRHQKPERLSLEQKQQLQAWLLDKQPADFGLDGYIWTAKLIAVLVKQAFGVAYQPSGIYKLLDRMGFSHQRAHRDYGNADKEEQEQFISGLKKSC